MNRNLKEIILWILIILPYIYLALIWNKLPEVVPTHFNINGMADDWSSKTSLIFIPGALGIFIYLLMIIIPILDPKKKIKQMGNKYANLRFVLTFFFSLLAIYCLNLSNAGKLSHPNFIITLIGGLFAILGNYFQSIRPNYFIGIRTPWTLENEEVWKKTHRIGGQLWMAGGILIVVLSLIINNNLAVIIGFGTIIFILTMIPIVYSYISFKKEKIVNQ